MGWQWHQPNHMQIICTTLQTDNHASTSSLNFLRARCSSWRPTNSVKALKAQYTVAIIIHCYRHFSHPPSNCLFIYDMMSHFCATPNHGLFIFYVVKVSPMFSIGCIRPRSLVHLLAHSSQTKHLLFVCRYDEPFWSYMLLTDGNLREFFTGWGRKFFRSRFTALTSSRTCGQILWQSIKVWLRSIV